MDKIFDIRQYLDEKRIYKSLKGHEIDFSFRPTAIDELYKEYAKLEMEVAIATTDFNKLQADFMETIATGENSKENNDKVEKEVEKLQLLTNKTKTLGQNIVILAAKSNGRDDITTEWMDTEMDPREFGFIIRFITGTEDSLEVKKK